VTPAPHTGWGDHVPRVPTAEDARAFRELIEQHGFAGAVALRLLFVCAVLALIFVPVIAHAWIVRSRPPARARVVLWLVAVPVLGAAVGATALVPIRAISGYGTVGSNAATGALLGAGVELLFVVPAALVLARRGFERTGRTRT